MDIACTAHRPAFRVPGISSLQYSAGILWALYRKDRAACAQEEATAQAQVHAEAAGLQLQSVVQELAVVTLQRDASLRERDALRVAAEAQQVIFRLKPENGPSLPTSKRPVPCSWFLVWCSVGCVGCAGWDRKSGSTA